MIEGTVPFAGGFYWTMAVLLVLARGADFFSTWVATPNLVLEGNPIARKLGWKWGIILNVALCAGLACMPFAAILLATTSMLIAARNFQSAWLMRSLGEHAYKMWYFDRFRAARLSLYLGCLAAQTLLVAAVGAGLIWSTSRPVPLAIGSGIIAYAAAVAFYSLLSVWRARHGLSYTPPKFFDAHADVE